MQQLRDLSRLRTPQPRVASSGPNRPYKKPGLGAGQAQAREGRPVWSAPNARNGIDPAIMGIVA